ncbi:carotenoid biosynthesis protein [Spirillospora sp. NPDC046719]
MVGPGNRRREGTRRGPDGFAVAGAGFLASMVAAQVTSGVGAEPVRWINPVVGALAAAAGCFAASRRGAVRAAGAVATAMALGHTVERIGVRTRLPFGRYTYTPVLRPQVGGVPVAVAVAWSGMGLAAHSVAAVLVPDRRPVRRMAVGALAFAVVFEPSDPVVAMTGGTAMGAFVVPAAVLAVRRRATGTGARRS